MKKKKSLNGITIWSLSKSLRIVLLAICLVANTITSRSDCSCDVSHLLTDTFSLVSGFKVDTDWCNIFYNLLLEFTQMTWGVRWKLENRSFNTLLTNTWMMNIWIEDQYIRPATFKCFSTAGRNTYSIMTMLSQLCFVACAKVEGRRLWGPFWKLVDLKTACLASLQPPWSLFFFSALVFCTFSHQSNA